MTDGRRVYRLLVDWSIIVVVDDRYADVRILAPCHWRLKTSMSLCETARAFSHVYYLPALCYAMLPASLPILLIERRRYHYFYCCSYRIIVLRLLTNKGMFKRTKYTATINDVRDGSEVTAESD